MSVCVCVWEGCKARVGIGSRLQLSVRLADLLEFIRGMSGHQRCVQLPQKHLATPETCAHRPSSVVYPVRPD